MTQQGTLGVAVIGTGMMGADHVRRINDVISGARVAAYAGGATASMRQFAFAGSDVSSLQPRTA